MQISVSEAKGQLLDLVRRAEAGEEVILTRHGTEVVRMVPMATRPSPEQRHMLLSEMFGTAKGFCEADAAHSQDFLYDERGLPR
ncbi:MAG TPA: type II toxin-antitoxin system prevent-host-death family antitoxin [Telmatospirillum sp.]|nr:type II toxin-antitoxin system prevent-host-death family antitoxin [Telmatospirillum sp.]